MTRDDMKLRNHSQETRKKSKVKKYQSKQIIMLSAPCGYTATEKHL